MSRPIKFRVWDKHYDRWEERPCIINKRGNLFIYNVDSDEWFEPQHTAYEVSWFTGLKDSYVDDMYLVNINPTEEVLYRVVWLSKMACFALWPQEARDDLPPIYGQEFADIIENNTPVGNIHQNPNLLEQDK